MDGKSVEAGKMIFDIIGYIAMVLLPIGILLVRKENAALKSDIILELGQIGLVINSF